MLLVDDQKLFRESLSSVLEIRNSNIKIVGQACNGEEGWQMAVRLRPDIILMDVRMPVMDGVESARLVRADCPESKIIMLTTFSDDEYVFEALKLGAVGYLLKDIQPAEVETAILTVYNGGVLMASDIAAKLVHKLTNIPGTPEPQLQQSKVQELLTPRELDVFRLLASGHDNKEIAEKLFLTEGTVRNHVSNIYSKLNLRDRVQAVKYAIAHGLF
ncbi:LuxR family two component transcriptional regulator [Hydrogenispora ethanolica]|uniref:LuxR family two component transcriptional regulator n=1 Tax=Hydrogenispora ethanolica TaxID=1082276 RepID=A0A4V2QAR9_HYDET|nr:LuxR family two component transcriptional regulator [Hydrogenispora ethanolica]